MEMENLRQNMIFMKNNRILKIILIILGITLISILIRYNYEVNTLKKDILSSEKVKIYFEGNGHTINLKTVEERNELIDLITDYKIKFFSKIEDVEKTPPAISLSFDGKEIDFFIYEKNSIVDFHKNKSKYFLVNFLSDNIYEKSLIKIYEKFCENYKKNSYYIKLKSRN